MNTLLPKKSVLLVIDVQNDFITGSLPIPDAEEIIPVLNRWIGHFYEDNLPVYYTRDWHPEDHCSFKSEENPDGWPPHCIQHTVGADLHSDLRVVSPWAMNVVKGAEPDQEQYSAMQGTCQDEVSLVDALYDDDIEILFIGGLATDYCVKETVLEALGLAFETVLIIEGIRPVDLESGFTALGVMVDAGATVV